MKMETFLFKYNYRMLISKVLQIIVKLLFLPCSIFLFNNKYRNSSNSPSNKSYILVLATQYFPLNNWNLPINRCCVVTLKDLSKE